MSERKVKTPRREERVLLDLLDRELGEEIPETDAGPLREYLEVLGLLPGALEEITPREETKRRLLETVIGGAQAAARPGPRSRTAWFPRLAAAFAALMIVVTTWVGVRLERQEMRIAELSTQLEAARGAAIELASARALLAQARSRLDMVTARGSEFCALSPPDGSSAAGARGVVVMGEGERDWFLRIEGLLPCPQGRKHTLWFATEAGPVRGPAFVVEAGEAVELTLGKRPDGIKAILITLESEPAPAAPSMEPLLFGNERLKLL